MTISLQHPTAGKKGLILRGVRINGVNKGVAQIRVTHPTLGDKQVWDGTLAGLTLSVDHPTVTGAGVGASGGFIDVDTSPATVTASDGSAPYTYAWTLAGDDSKATWTAYYPSSAGTTFRAASIAVGDLSVATFTCTVTDARGATGTVNVTAQAAAYNV